MENRKTILAIDDNRDILYTLEQICRFQGWNPLLAGGYEEAQQITICPGWMGSAW